MSFADELTHKTNWTQEEINSFKAKHRRTHFDHFSGLALKPQRVKRVRGVKYVWKFGAWRRSV